MDSMPQENEAHNTETSEAEHANDRLEYQQTRRETESESGKELK